MYQKQVISESLEGISLEEVKLYLRQLGYTPEDGLIEQQIEAAISMAENYCNRAFTAKELTISSDASTFYLFGVIDLIEDITVTLDETETTAYKITGAVEPKFNGYGEGIWTVSYTTLAGIPATVREWIKQSVAEMYDRNSAEAVNPNIKLLEPHRNIVWLV